MIMDNKTLTLMAQNAITLASAIEEAGGSASMVLMEGKSLNEFLIVLARNNIVLKANYIKPT